METPFESDIHSGAAPLGYTAEGPALGCILPHTRPGERLTDIEPSKVIRIFKQHGAVLFRGFAPDTNGFRALTERFGQGFIIYPSKQRVRISEDATIQTVDSEDRPIRLHSELSYLPLRPDLCWFYCVRPPALGGQTILCDGLQVVFRLSPETRQFLEKQPLRYQAELTPDLWQPLLGVETVEQARAEIEHRGYQADMTFSGDTLRVDTRLPALRKPRFTDGLAFVNNLIHTGRGVQGRLKFEDGSILPEAKWDELTQLTEHLSVEVAWQAGDVLMLDNSRILHGRRRIEPGDGRLIYTRFCAAAFS